MASYAALVSLKTTIKTIQYHPNPPISLDNQQADALMEKITFLQAFLEDYSHREDHPTDGLESRITDTASPAEGAIESYIADTIGGFTNHVESNHRYDRFYQDLQRYIEEMDVIMKEAKVIEEMMTGDDNEQLVGFSAVPSQASSSQLGQNTTVVGFDEVSVQVLEKLEADHQSNRQIIPIVGMGGIGKTTLAIKAYEHPRVAHIFDTLVWVTISQRFKIREILLQIIRQRKLENEEDLSHMSEEELGRRIYQNLYGKKYLIVMDDLWSSEAWDQIQIFFPKNDNNYGSRVIVTTRNEDIAFQLSSRDGDDIQYMKLLTDDESWNLFSKTVFEERPCPLELEEIGKIIVRNCKGLPLSIVVTGGFLMKSEKTKQQWEDVAKNLDSSVSVKVNEQCSKILNLSYRRLPINLKSCFLYIAVVYPEDANIPVSVLIKLLVAEGFLETKGDDILEDVLRDYIDDLVDRNLVMVDHLGSCGNIKVCKMHDLVRDFCVREAQKQKLLCVVEAGNPNTQCGENNLWLRAPLVRSLMWESDKDDNESLTFRYLRVLVRTSVAAASTNIAHHFPAVSQFSNSRFLVFHCIPPKKIFSTMPVIWNLQTLIIKVIWKLQTQGWITEALEIWKMPRLRHVKMPRLSLPSPPGDDTVLQNLQTLCYVREFKCTEDIVKRIPNILKLGINCCEHSGSYSDLCLNNLEHLKKLENLRIELPLSGPRCAENLYAFPESLTKLVLFGGAFHFEDVSGKIGSLPFLGKLELNSLSGTEWRLHVEEEFSSLESLSIFHCEDLKYWGASVTHFPVLQDLTLTGLEKLEEIPSDIGEIPTLGSLVVNCCSNSAVDSAKAIAEEQESENSVLKVHVVLTKENMQLKSCLQNFVVVQEANTVEMIIEKCIIPEEGSSEECRVEEDGSPQSESNTKHHSSPHGESSCSAPIQYKKQRTSSPSP